MKKIVSILFLLLISALLTQCSDNPVVNQNNTKITPDITIDNTNELIEFGYGQTVLIEEENLLIKFEEVEEGRCPTGAYCFCEGQATCSLLLIKPNEGRGTARPAIRPSTRPGTADYWILSADALGYRLYLEELTPYPDINNPIRPEDYIAKLRIEKNSGCPARDEVCFTRATPEQLQKNAVTLQEVELSGDDLTLTVSYGGGCGVHGFRLFMQPAFMESLPVQANLYLQHTNFEDCCRAYITQNISFDIRPIAELHKEQYGDYAEITLNVYGYFSGTPDNKISISYTPE